MTQVGYSNYRHISHCFSQYIVKGMAASQKMDVYITI